MEGMAAGGNLSSESQHDGHDVGGVDDMRSDPYRPRSPQTKIDARVRHVQFKERAAYPSSIGGRTDRRTDSWRSFATGSLFPFLWVAARDDGGGVRELYDRLLKALLTTS